MDLSIEHVDLTDPAAIAWWNGIGRTAWTHGREAAWWSSDEAAVARYTSPRPHMTTVALVARVGDEVVGSAEANVEAGEPAEVEVSVLPGWRRRGIGPALYEEVRTGLGDRADIVQTEVYTPEAVAFAQAMGLSVANEEVRQLLDLPCDVPAEAAPDGVEVRCWVGACPDELVEDWARLVSGMDVDVPVGELTHRPRTWDTEKVRTQETRMAAQGYRLVRAIALLEGRGIGYSNMFVSDPAPEIVLQDDTFVAAPYRGRRVARALKLANLAHLQTLPGHEQFRWVQTYTSVGNEPMLALNRAVGFRVADTMTALEGPLHP